MKEQLKFASTSKSVKSSSLSLQSINDIHRGDCFPLGMFSVGDSISDYIFQKDFEDTSGFFVDQAGDTFDSSSSCQSSDGWFGDTLDVITKNLSVTFGSSLS